MDVFDLDQALVSDYERFARSFTQIRADDIRQQIDAIYASRRFWPEPLLSINPHYERGANIEELVSNGSLSPETGKGTDFVLVMNDEPQGGIKNRTPRRER